MIFRNKSTFLGSVAGIVREARTMRLSLPILALCLVLPTAALATGDKATRYPFDPVCPWGRLSNGKGMIHRCITEDEARALAEAAQIGKKVGADSDEDKSTAKPATSKAYEMTVGPISAEQGEIEVGRLDVPLERYKKCIDDNGGLKNPSGEIVVKFLVRAERVRAEGASVDSFDNVSRAAAECVAAVVDRRQTGVPSVPMTGAKLTFSLQEKK